MLSVRPVVHAQAAATARQQAQTSLAGLAVVIEAAHRDAAARALSVASARRAAIRAAAKRAAARRAAARQAGARQAQAQPAATDAAVEPVPPGTAQGIAEQMLAQYGWTGQFACLDALWTNESGWNVYAQNPSSGAYGIPQALPADKMASAGPDWESDAATQIRWGLAYIQGSYGSPCAAWSHEEATGWY